MTWQQTGPILIDRGRGPEPLVRAAAPAPQPPPPSSLTPLPALGGLPKAVGWFWPERRWYWFEVMGGDPAKRVFARQWVKLTEGEAEEYFIDLKEAFWDANVYRWYWTGAHAKRDR